MFGKQDCSYEAYRKILADIRDSGKYCDYGDVLRERRQKYLVLRHDIEFSVERAFSLAQIETEEGISSSWFVQITNNAYNPFSQECTKMLKKMANNGHHIGLHYHRGSAEKTEEIAEDVVRQAQILEEMTGIRIDRFSFHRPPAEFLTADLTAGNLINTYGHSFFSYSESPDDMLPVKYIADSNHQWKYGWPEKAYFDQFDKIQLLIHPLSWSKQGADHLQNFRELAKEKHDVFGETVEHEWKLFEELRGKI